MATKKKAEAFQPSGDVRRVQSLGGGRWVRIGDHKGKWHHLSVDNDPDEIAMLVAEVLTENPSLGEKIRAELLALDADEFDYLGIMTTEDEEQS